MDALLLACVCVFVGVCGGFRLGWEQHYCWHVYVSSKQKLAGPLATQTWHVGERGAHTAFHTCQIVRPQGGVRYAADVDSLAVIACGSAEVLAAANASAGGGAMGQQAQGWAWWGEEEDSFLRD